MKAKKPKYLQITGKEYIRLCGRDNSRGPRFADIVRDRVKYIDSVEMSSKSHPYWAIIASDGGITATIHQDFYDALPSARLWLLPQDFTQISEVV